MKKFFISGLLLFAFMSGYAQGSKDDNPKLPVVVVPAPADDHVPMVLMITGDRGWKRFDRRLTREFVHGEAPVVVLNSFRYFRKKKTPEQTTLIVEELLNQYMEKWHKSSFILDGYSFGAEVIPFIVNRMSEEMLRHCKGVVLFSPGNNTDFEIHLAPPLPGHEWGYNVVSEIQSMKPVKTLFFFGERERKFPLKVLSRPDWQLIYLKGGHSYRPEKRDVGGMVLKRLGIE